MTAVESVKQQLKQSDNSMKFLEAMRDQPLFRAEGKGQHAWWILGHLTVAEGRTHKVLHGGPSPAGAAWHDLFDWGTEPSPDGKNYPPFDELFGKYRDLRAKLMEHLDTLSDADLDAKTKDPPPGLEKPFGVVGPFLLTLASHQAFHCGEAAAIRRAAGAKPYFEPTAAMKAHR